MIDVVGFDLGLRKVHAFALHDDGHAELWHIDLPKMQRRDIEIKEIYRQVRSRFADVTSPCFVEEPVVAGARNMRVSLGIAQTAGAVMSGLRAPTYLVPVSSWKMFTVGKGNATKDEVSLWLSERYQAYHALCAGTNSPQDYTDATCIALYGSQIIG